MGSTRQTRTIRQTVLDRDRWHCHYCHEPIHPRCQPHRYCDLCATVDHLIHARDGGPTTPDNLVAACRHCNLTRGVGNRPRPRTRPTRGASQSPGQTAGTRPTTASSPPAAPGRFLADLPRW